MAPRDGVRCWICGRTVEEVQQLIGNPAAEVTDVDRSMAKVVDARTRFAKTVSDWWEGVPEQFKNMDFNFVMGNPTQFKSIRFLDDVQQARKSHVEAVWEVVGRGREGKDFTIGDMKVDANDERRRQAVMREVEDFERRTGRALDGGKQADEASRPKGFDGLKLGEGLRYLRDVGAVYYTLQQRLLEVDKEDERKKMPTIGIGMAKVKSFPKPVPLCTVCEGLIKGL